MQPYQLSLFSESSGGGPSVSAHAGGLMPALKACMQRALAAATPPLSREQLVDRMNEIARHQGLKITSGRSKVLTTSILDKWLAPNDSEDVPPILAFEVFMMALGNFDPLRLLVEFNGCKMVTPDEIPVLMYGREKLEAKERARRLKRLEEDIADQRKQAGR